MPVACQSATRPAVQTRARVRAAATGAPRGGPGCGGPSPAPDGAVERGAQRNADVRQRRGRVRLAEPVCLVRDSGEKCGQLSRGQFRQPDCAEVGMRNRFDVLGVRQPGGQPVPQPPRDSPGVADLISPRPGQRLIAGLAGCHPGPVVTRRSRSRRPIGSVTDTWKYQLPCLPGPGGDNSCRAVARSRNPDNRTV